MFNHPVQYLEKYSSTRYTTAIFMLASGHHGLEIKILYYCAPYSSVLYSNVHKNTMTCRGCTHMMVCTRHMN